MDWQSLSLSLWLALATLLLLLPFSILVGRSLAIRDFPGKRLIEAAITLPLILPPTVLGYGLLLIWGKSSWIGAGYEKLFGHSLVFTFDGLVWASIFVNLPFAILPVERAFANIGAEIKESAASLGAAWHQILWRIEIPLALPGILSAAMMVFAHTMGEFGAVLMIGGNIPGVTRTASIAIYDRVQSFDKEGALYLAFSLLLISVTATVVASFLIGTLFKKR